jgi:aspartate aminotransferase-like enzyme
VTAVKLPAGMTGPEASEAIKARGITVGGGYGQLRDSTIRIGHMGDHTIDGIQRCLHACEAAITELAERRQLVRA